GIRRSVAQRSGFERSADRRAAVVAGVSPANSKELQLTQLPLQESCVYAKSGPGFFIPEPLRKPTRVIMVLAVESPLPFSCRALASSAPALAQPQLALRPLAARQVDRRRLVPSLFYLASHRYLRRQAAWLEVY